jgi:hypothetical protein
MGKGSAKCSHGTVPGSITDFLLEQVDMAFSGLSQFSFVWGMSKKGSLLWQVESEEDMFSWKSMKMSQLTEVSVTIDFHKVVTSYLMLG